MMTWIVQGAAAVQFAFWGIVAVRTFVPICCVLAVDPAGRPSAMTGWVFDHTGFVMIAGVQLVPDIAIGSGIVVSVCVALAPSIRAMRYHPGCAMVAVTVILTVSPAINPVTMCVGVHIASPRPVFGMAAHGQFFCGLPVESCDILLTGFGASSFSSVKCARAEPDRRRPIAPTTDDATILCMVAPEGAVAKSNPPSHRQPRYRETRAFAPPAHPKGHQRDAIRDR